MQIKIINQSDNPLPSYQTTGAAGMDICAYTPVDIVLLPLDRKQIPTGLFIELPDGYEGQIRPRSGLAFKQGITLPNSPATIDSDYRGEIKVALINLSTQSYTVRSGDRIAQMVIARYEKATWLATDSLSETERGTGGFGHTGL